MHYTRQPTGEDGDINMDKYKKKVKGKLYKNYFTTLHASEKKLSVTSTKLVNDDILEIFKKNAKRRLLDAGCGDGLFIDAAKKNGIQCEGFDTNRDLLAICTKKGYSVKYGDISQKLPFADNTFDGIFCSNVFEHLPEPDFALYELLRIMKKGGILMITVPEANNTIFYNDWTHVTPFTKNTLKNLTTCVNVGIYRIYRRHFPVLVRFWNIPFIKYPVRTLNFLIKKGPLAELFTWLFEKMTWVHRHDLVLEIIK